MPTKLNTLQDIDSLRLYGKDVNIGRQYNYLGVILDSEMTLRPFISYIKPFISHKIFTLAKIRICLTVHAAVMIYKLTILPCMEYAGLPFVVCTIDDSRGLQICLNDALCIWTKQRIIDHFRIDELHVKCKTGTA